MCVQKIIWADDEIWTRDLFLTKEVLYPWATSAYTKRAGDEVRTRDIQLGRLTLYQLSYSRKKNKNMTVGRTGFEPVKVKPADLQSALVGRLSISPRNFKLLKYVLILSRQRDSNPRPRDYKSRALANWAMPAFLSYRAQKYNKFWNLQNFWEFFLWFLMKYFLRCWKSNGF